MSIPLFFPAVKYLPNLVLRDSITIKELCAHAGITCRASGSWTSRKVEIVHADSLSVIAEPGDWGNVIIQMPLHERQQRARLALAVLAYGMHDLVAKQSVAGLAIMRLGPPKGRRKAARAMSVAERQRRFRERKRT